MHFVLQITRLTRTTLQPFSALLKDEPFFFGAKTPSPLDIRLYSVLAPLLIQCTPLSAQIVPQVLRTEYPTLVTHTSRVADYLWAIGDIVQDNAEQQMFPLIQRLLIPQAKPINGTSLLNFRAWLSNNSAIWNRVCWTKKSSSRSDANPPSEKKEMSSMEKQETRRIQIGRYIWLATAVVGTIGWAFASGIIRVDLNAEDSPNESIQNINDKGNEDENENDHGSWQIVNEDDEIELEDDENLDDVDEQDED